MGSDTQPSETAGAQALATFAEQIPEVKQYIADHAIDACWPDLGAMLRSHIEHAPLDYAVLPLASCVAAGGAARLAYPWAAAWSVLSLAMRILDDVEDRDDPDSLWRQIGAARAFHFSASLYALSNRLLLDAPWPDARCRAISRAVTNDLLTIAAGQDADLRGATATLEGYWATAASKNGAAFAMACGVGALCGSDRVPALTALREFGMQLGIALQLFDDFEGTWAPTGAGDLAIGKITLPVIYAMNRGTEWAAPLRDLVQAGSTGQVLEILERAGAREFMVDVALGVRRKAIECLASLDQNRGVKALEAYVDGLFADVEALLA